MPDEFDLEIPIRGRDDEPLEAILERRPDLKDSFTGRRVQVDRLIEKGDWKNLEFLYRIYPRNPDAFLVAVGRAGPSPEARHFVEMLFDHGEHASVLAVLKNHPGWANHPDLMDRFIQGRGWLHGALETIRKPEWEPHRWRLAQRIYEVGEDSDRERLRELKLVGSDPKCDFGGLSGR